MYASAPRFCGLVKQVQRFLGPQFTPVSKLAASLPEPLRESLDDQCGGLGAFLRSKPSDFILRHGPGSILEAKCLTEPPPPHPPRQAAVGPRLQGTNNKGLPARIVAFPVEFTGSSTNPTSEGSEHTKNAEAKRVFLHTERQVSGPLFLAEHPQTGDIWIGNQYKQSTHAITSCQMPSLCFEQARRRVETHEVLRLARMLSCDRFTPIADVEDVCGAILSVPLFQVILTVPERFEVEIEPPDTPITTPNVQPSPSPPLSPVSSHIEDRFRVSKIKGVRYRCFFDAGRSPKLRDLSYSDLSNLAMEAKSHRRDSKSLKSHRMNIAIRKEFTLRANPHGSPYFDDDVLAYFVYDLLEGVVGKPLQLDAIRELLTSSNIPLLRLDQSFFHRFSHLFIVEEQKAMQLRIQRRETPASHSDLSLRILSPEETILEILNTLPKDTTFYMSRVCLQLTRMVRYNAKHHFGSVRQLFLRYPSVFSVSDETDVVTQQPDGVQKLFQDLSRTKCVP